MLRCPLFFNSDRNGTERCESGRIGVPGEHECWQRHRGFESHPLRHSWRDRNRQFIDPRAVARQSTNRSQQLITGNGVASRQESQIEGGIRTRGIAGERLPRVGRHEGAGPLSGSASCERDFESHPLRHTWRDRNRQFIDPRAVARQTYQQAMNFHGREVVRTPLLHRRAK